MLPHLCRRSYQLSYQVCTDRLQLHLYFFVYVFIEDHNNLMFPGLVIDGSVSFPFNDGTEALLEIHPEDTLMTVHMDDALHH